MGVHGMTTKTKFKKCHIYMSLEIMFIQCSYVIRTGLHGIYIKVTQNKIYLLKIFKSVHLNLLLSNAFTMDNILI